ncbi:MAG: VTC domain-containing protein, partial [Flavobacteriales bacterium]|nr:VTC domain-containing protein [Flavobacteriales bacterium]
MTLEPIGLEGIERVSLQKRFDLKFIFSNENFGTVFSLLKNDFFVLEVENKRIQKYLNYYFDTDFYQFYLSHHNGKLNRTKLRKRCYVESELAFLEHKFK